MKGGRGRCLGEGGGSGVVCEVERAQDEEEVWSHEACVY